MPTYTPSPFTATPRGRSKYWADADDAYITAQQALGRDTTEYRTDIRLAWADINHERRAKAGQRPPRIDWDGFTVQRMPWYERVWARLRGWDA